METKQILWILTLESCLWEHVHMGYRIVKPQATLSPTINDIHLGAIWHILSYESGSLIFFFFPFCLHKNWRCRTVLMPLAVLINCDSGPRNKPLHLNIERPAVQYLVLMSLSLKSLHLCFLFYFWTPASPQLFFLCQSMSLVKAFKMTQVSFWSDVLINRTLPCTTAQRWLFGSWLREK